MCLSTAYLNSRDEDRVAARYVQSIEVNGRNITLTDVLGSRTEVEGVISYVDLTGGSVIISTAEQ